MLKLMSLMKRNSDVTLSQFRRWAQEEHPRLALAIPGLKAYKVNVCLTDDQTRPYDAVNELWFDNDAARVAGLSSSAGKKAAEDAMIHCAFRTHLLVEERELL